MKNIWKSWPYWVKVTLSITVIIVGAFIDNALSELLRIPFSFLVAIFAYTLIVKTGWSAAKRGGIIGGIIWITFVAFSYVLDLKCAGNSACGIGTGIAIFFLWLLIPIGATVGLLYGKWKNRKNTNTGFPLSRE